MTTDNITLESVTTTQLLLPKSKQRFVTCAAPVEEEYLVCADKTGTVFVYDLSTATSTEVKSYASQLYTIEN